MKNKLSKNKLSNLNFSDNLLDNWRLQIAIEVARYLKNQRPVLCDKSEIIEQLDFNLVKDFTDPIASLETKIAESKKTATALGFKELEDVKVELTIYFSETIVSQIQQTGGNILSSLISQVQTLLSEDIRQASPQILMYFLTELLQELFEIKNKLKDRQAQAIRNESRGWVAYSNLSNLGNTQNKEEIWNSLSFSFKNKLQSKIFEIYGKIVFDLIQFFQSCHQFSRSSYIVLDSIELSLKAKCSLDFATGSSFSDLNKINHDQQLQLIESSTEEYLNYLSKSKFTWEEIELKLLENLEPTAQEILADFKARFLELTILSKTTLSSKPNSPMKLS